MYDRAHNCVKNVLPECLVKTMLMKFSITIICKYQSLGKIAIKFLQ